MFDSRIAALEHTVNDVVVKSLVEANDQYEYDQGLEAFRGAHPELAEMDPKLKALYGEDYDTAKQLYDARPKEYAEGQDENSWVAQELAIVNDKLNALMSVVAPAAEETETKVPAETEEKTEVKEGVPAEDEISEEQLAEELKAAEGK
jgi:hypothetical protein